jgi:uncharacterized protein (TIGR00269 family)
MEKCNKCRAPAIIYIKYNGVHLCQKHFRDYFETRVKRAIRQQGKLPSKGLVAVALSGGVDSLITLKLLAELIRQRPKVDLHAISINEGIKGYRDLTLKTASYYCNEWKIPWHLLSFKTEVGYTLDEISLIRDGFNECTYCGVFRRWLINLKAKEINACKLATGHQLDDIAQTILMNWITADMEKLARLGPHSEVQPGLIPRIMPLKLIPKAEVKLYASLNGVKIHSKNCPYSIRAFRKHFKEIIEFLESKKPGISYSIIKSYDLIKDTLLQNYGLKNLNPCKKCGEPTSQAICKKCELLEKLKKAESTQ